MKNGTRIITANSTYSDQDGRTGTFKGYRKDKTKALCLMDDFSSSENFDLNLVREISEDDYQAAKAANKAAQIASDFHQLVGLAAKITALSDTEWTVAKSGNIDPEELYHIWIGNHKLVGGLSAYVARSFLRNTFEFLKEINKNQPK